MSLILLDKSLLLMKKMRNLDWLIFLKIKISLTAS